MLGRESHRVMLRRIRLDDHFSPEISAARPSGDLRYEVKGPFAGPEIRQVQVRIGGYHPYQRNLGEIEPFSDHLCAYYNVDLMRFEFAEHPVVSPSFRHGIRIHPDNARLRKYLLQS